MIGRRITATLPQKQRCWLRKAFFLVLCQVTSRLRDLIGVLRLRSRDGSSEGRNPPRYSSRRYAHPLFGQKPSLFSKLNNMPCPGGYYGYLPLRDRKPQ